MVQQKDLDRLLDRMDDFYEEVTEMQKKLEEENQEEEYSANKSDYLRAIALTLGIDEEHFTKKNGNSYADIQKSGVAEICKKLNIEVEER